jgi:hypothetical protein
MFQISHGQFGFDADTIDQAREALRAHRQHSEPAPELDQPDDLADPISFMWALVEAWTVDDLAFLWSSFDDRARQLRELAQFEHLSPVLAHMARAVGESVLLALPANRRRRAAILEAIAAAATGQLSTGMITKANPNPQ